MFTLKRAQAGFTLIEVVAAAALLGLMVTMAMPNLNGAAGKIRDAKLKSDLATVDQAIQLYIIETGSVPSKLDDLAPDYITKVDNIKDAKNTALSYSVSGSTYTLKGKDSADKDIYSNGSSNIPAETKPELNTGEVVSG